MRGLKAIPIATAHYALLGHATPHLQAHDHCADVLVLLPVEMQKLLFSSKLFTLLKAT